MEVKWDWTWNSRGWVNMLAARCTCAPPQGFVRHNSVPPSGVEMMAMNEWCMKPALYNDSRCTETWQCGHTLLHTLSHNWFDLSIHLSTISFALQSLPFGCLRKKWRADQRNPTWQEPVEWLQRRRRRKQTHSRRGNRAMALDKMSTRCCGASSNSTSDGFMC